MWNGCSVCHGMMIVWNDFVITRPSIWLMLVASQWSNWRIMEKYGFRGRVHSVFVNLICNVEIVSTPTWSLLTCREIYLWVGRASASRTLKRRTCTYRISCHYRSCVLSTSTKERNNRSSQTCRDKGCPYYHRTNSRYGYYLYTELKYHSLSAKQ